MTEPLPDEVDDALWAEACRRAAAIREFLVSSSGPSTVAAIADLASELQVSQATTYRLLRRFRTDGTVMSLIETKRGRPAGALPSCLSSDVKKNEAYIYAVICAV